MNTAMMRSGKANRLVYLVLGLLLIAVAALALLNSGDRELQRALEEKREFLILTDGDYTATVNLHIILDLDPQRFTTSFATSITAQRETVMHGVELRLLLEALKVDTTRAVRYTVSGMDGYYSPLTREEVENEESVYICYSMDDKILEAQSEGGYGPFMMVIRGSHFAQRWCKYVEAVDVITE